MAKSRASKVQKKARQATSPLMVRLDADSKACLTQAVDLRRISVSDYVRAVTIAQARREVLAANMRIITLTSDEQIAFWKSLNETPKLTAAQRRLASLMHES